MLRKKLGRFFPYVLAVAWIVTAAHTVRSVGNLEAANVRLAQESRAHSADPCACASS
jgi:hypothetical protein